MSRFLLFYVARRNAAELDRQGKAPGPVINALTTVTSVAVLGMGACVIVFLGSVLLWSLGI